MPKSDGWFKPGNNLGHKSNGGRPSLPSELRLERKENQAAFIRLVARYLAFTDEQMLQRMAGPDATQVEGIIFGMIGKAKEGDVPAAKYLVETMTGKIPDSDEFTEEDIRILKRIKEVMDEQRRASGAGTSDSQSSDGAAIEQIANNSRLQIPEAT